MIPLPNGDLAGRVVIITGAGQGIGKVLARSFASVSSVVVVAEIDTEKAECVESEITAEGGQAIALPVDVTDASSVEAMINAVVSTLGRIDVLVNNAALFSNLAMRPFDQIPLEEWDRVLRVNVTGVFLCARAVVPIMKKAGWGRIINMSSGAVTLGRPNYLHYITSKSALIGMTSSMARELGPHGITVNAILPGAIFTELPRASMTPEQKKTVISLQCIPLAETPEDLVGAVFFLASTSSTFITGQAITVDGGCTHR